jgi:uncharacterized protein YjbJ (UPF0337 family)
MGERMDELKGNIKQGAGRVTGDTDLEAEGKTQQESAEAKRKIKGGATELKGNVEEGLGNMSGNEEVRERGIADRLKGKIDRS